MKIYTRTGDEGTTALFGGGRVPKTHPRIEAYGTVDETNSMIGLARAHLGESQDLDRVHRLLAEIQSDLFTLGADLATPESAKARTVRISDDAVARLEQWIDETQEELSPIKQFILPAGSAAAAALHVARTTSRRAERLVLRAGESESISRSALVYLNRLSDLLFVLARLVNKLEGANELTWSGKT